MFSKLVALFVLLMFTRQPGNPVGAGLIDWSASRRLVWADFMGKPGPGAVNAALTSSRINFSYGYGSREGFHFNIACAFEKNNSWVRVKNDWILAHEQGHFDLTEIYARRLARELRQYHFDKENAAATLNAIYARVTRQLNERQNLYDAQTDFSRNKPAQEKWLETIRTELKDLDTYANYN